MTLVSSVGSPFMHQGLFHDPETGTDQNRFRQLHGRLGRFMQRDPIGYAGGLNTYAYLGSSVLARLDPLGLIWTKKACAKMLDQIQKAVKEIEKDVNKFCPMKDDGGHQNELDGRFKKLDKLRKKWNRSGCGKKLRTNYSN